MCGLAGFWAFRHLPYSPTDTAQRMADTLIHRGPDDAGVWVDEAAGLAFAHRRLAILDLSPAGHQPMVSATGRYVIVFNGEIYNHQDLRRDLDILGSAPVWRGHSDTETLLACFESWGVEKTLRATVGMFALALWDRSTRTLTLARDRMGEKPLYYGWVNQALVFGSELKSLRAFPGFDNPINRGALSLFLRYDYVPAPWSIYEKIWKLPPGCYVQFHGCSEPYETGGDVKPYWRVVEAIEVGLQEPFIGSETEATEELEQRLRCSIAGQMIADVPVGAFLSGGIDSSTVVALMQDLSPRPVKTFTIGFHERNYNEAEHAKAVARHLGTDHTEFYVTPKDAMAVIPQLSSLYDEPFADASQIPTFMVSQLARSQVTVSLSGDGGDELFGGYHRYFGRYTLWRRLAGLPMTLRRALAFFLTIPSPRGWDRLFAILQPVLPPFLQAKLTGDKIPQLVELLVLDSVAIYHYYCLSHWRHPAKELVLGATEPETIFSCPHQWPPSMAKGRRFFEEVMMFLDQLTYLPDDILVKVDRAAMGVSLETRVPFLDHRVVEFAWQLPLAMKIRRSQSKWLLRQVLYKYVPKELIERPKMGFAVPLDQWLRGPLREWAEDLLSAERLTREGFLDPKPVRQKWAEHLSGLCNRASYLWGVLMWEAFLEGT
ncbi:MAG: asparagine synthetase B [Thermosynechococcus sp.]|uniref:asparagine synthase (glutamine-hydrolyzing) n=1 Tax=Thermosynechococcus sp. TaxID=2814275 RepID=UPI0021FE34A6|nr:asparagine synthase (glutamine-hydrolyzing) [Thermosynechococcus sp.]BCX11981.1 MAG: asparagine synthetase B [Thermosynechococcus sp.]